MVTSSPRQRILETASEMFYAQGVRAVGVDAIIARAAVAKASFYKHFQSKDDLIVAYLMRRDELWRRWLEESVGRLAKSADKRPLAVFDALAERFATNDFRGCAFINSMAELADRSHAAHVAAAHHKQQLTAFLRKLLAEAGVAANPLAEQFMILIDGSIVTALRKGDSAPAKTAKQIAAMLLHEARERKFES
ncbi:TetR/AcrR family transcriptional regulator [Bradyrhizobium sp. LB13.1]